MIPSFGIFSHEYLPNIRYSISRNIPRRISIECVYQTLYIRNIHSIFSDYMDIPLRKLRLKEYSIDIRCYLGFNLFSFLSLAEGYIEESLNNKVEVANKIFTVQNIQHNNPITAC